MPDKTDSGPRQNPLPWIALGLVGLILYVVISGERDEFGPMTRPADETLTGEIRRELLLPPGMRAREYIGGLREQGKPYPVEDIYARAQGYLDEGSLADAHLLYFFAARENHLPAIMKLGEMSDPASFRVADSLLDEADIVQAYKWYSRAADLGDAAAAERLAGLQRWAVAEAQSGNRNARQLLLNFQ